MIGCSKCLHKANQPNSKLRNDVSGEFLARHRAMHFYYELKRGYGAGFYKVWPERYDGTNTHSLWDVFADAVQVSISPNLLDDNYDFKLRYSGRKK